jgi:hypothetical protein
MLTRSLLTGCVLLALSALSLGTACGAPPPPPTEGPTTPLESEDSLTRVGVYPTEQYDSGLPDSPSFGPATVFYPGGGSNGPFPAVAMAPGFGEPRSIFDNWGRFLSSHGYIVLTLNTNADTDLPELRANALLAAINVVRGENTRTGSPLNGKVLVNSMAVMGHSMGGGGALIAASRNPSGVLAAIPMHPWGGLGMPSIRVPTLVFAAQGDNVAGASLHAWQPYNQIPTTTNKGYIEFAGATALQEHFIANDPLGELPSQKIVAKATLSWLRAYVRNDRRYLQYIRREAALSRYDSTF